MNVDEPSQLISVETSLRMTWKDPRLNVTINDALSDDFVLFGPDVMKYIWVPDVYIDGIQELRSPAYKVKSLSVGLTKKLIRNKWDQELIFLVLQLVFS